MRIDERIGKQVREAFAAAVGEERDRFNAALDGISDENGPKAWTYAVFVVGYVVNDIEATEEDLDGIAERAVAAVSSWFDLGSKNSVKALLKGASEGGSNMPGVRKTRS